MTILLQDNFDSDTIGNQAPNWTNGVGVFTVGADYQSGSNLVYGAVSAADGNTAFLTGMTATSSMLFETQQRFRVSGNTVGCIVRAASDGSTGYLVNVGVTSGLAVIQGFKKTAPTTYTHVGTDSGTVATLVANDIINLRVIATGSTISAYIAKNGGAYSSTPDWTYTDTSSPFASGIVGIYTAYAGSGAQPTIDSYVVTDNAVAATAVTVTPSTLSGTVGVASSAFTVTHNGTTSGADTITPTATGCTFSPTTASVTGTATATFTCTASSTGAKSITFASSLGLTSATATFTAASSGAATAVSLTGPSTGLTGVASANFTVTANGTLASSVVVTPASDMGGTFTPATITLTSGTLSGTFTFTPPAAGTDAVTITNSGSLTNSGSPIIYVATSGSGGDVWDTVIDGTYTARQLMRLLSAAILGTSSGQSTIAPSFKSVTGTKVRIASTLDENRNRVSVVLDPN